MPMASGVLGNLAVSSMLSLGSGKPWGLLELRRERIPVSQVPLNQLRREGSLPVQRLRLLQVRQV